MKELSFPLLKADDIECRVGTVKENEGYSLLLYKTARTDAKYLDQVVGAMNWQVKYYLLNDVLFCSIGVYNEERNEWIWKDDCGSETEVEKEKGQSSDAFKRAGFRWSIGRSELYSAPFIWIKEEGVNKLSLKKRRWEVKSISYNANKEIETLEIVNEKGEVVYSYGLKKTQVGNSPKTIEKKEVGGFEDLHEDSPIKKEQLDAILMYAFTLSEERHEKFDNWLTKSFGTSDFNALTEKQANEVIKQCHIGEQKW